MAVERFRTAVESGDMSRLLEALAPDVVFRSPAVFQAYEGRDAAAPVLAAVFEVFEDFRYVAEYGGDAGEVLVFEARVGTKQIQGVDIIGLAPDGRVAELTVMVRPLSGLLAVVEAVGAKLAALPVSQSITTAGPRGARRGRRRRRGVRRTR